MVRQLEARYGGQVEFRHYVLDDLAPGTPAYAEMQRTADACDFRVTPTFLIADAHGHVRGRYEGSTSYWSLKRDLEAAIAAR